MLVPNFHSSIASLEQHALASVRMRSALIARAAENAAWKVTLGERFDTHPKVLYVGKIGGYRIESRGPAWLEYMAKAQAHGSRVIVDYTDHHCGFKSAMNTFYTHAIALADELITPSAMMTQQISTMSFGRVTEIPDPCEVEPAPPRAPGLGPWRALWFGSCTNISYLIDFLSSPNNLSQLRQLNVVTDTTGISILKQWSRSINPVTTSPVIESFTWSLKNLTVAAAKSDIALIPSDPNDPRKAGVSENRLVTALQLGLVTVASPLPAYLPLSNLFVKLNYGWGDAVLHSDPTNSIACGTRSQMLGTYSKSAMMARWTALLDSQTQHLH